MWAGRRAEHTIMCCAPFRLSQVQGSRNIEHIEQRRMVQNGNITSRRVRLQKTDNYTPATHLMGGMGRL